MAPLPHSGKWKYEAAAFTMQGGKVLVVIKCAVDRLIDSCDQIDNLVGGARVTTDFSESLKAAATTEYKKANRSGRR